MTTLPWDDMRSSVKDDGKQRVPDGVYECVLKSTDLGTTANGYNKINARFVVETGPYKGGSIFNSFVITPDKPGGVDLFYRNLAALGLAEDVLQAAKPSLEQLAEMMKDRRAELTLATRMFNGKEYDDVKNMKSVGVPGTGYAFGGDTILPSGSTIPAAVPAVPSVPPVPMPVANQSQPPMPVPPVSAELTVADGSLPPEPPF